MKKKLKNSSKDDEKNYLIRYVRQIMLPLEEKGFWDSKINNWAKTICWDGKNWTKRGSRIHDWKYSLELQEGALQFSLITKNKLLDRRMKQELGYINNYLDKYGKINTRYFEKYSYGVLLSVLSLGYIKFFKKNSDLAQKCYENMEKIFFIIKKKWSTPSTEDQSSSLLKGFANMFRAGQIKGNKNLEPLKKIIRMYAEVFIAYQSREGFWKNKKLPFGFLLRFILRRYCDLTAIQEMEKRDIALLLAYDCVKNEKYIKGVEKNIDYILKNRLRSDGGLVWDRAGHKNNYLFFECHQMWMLIVLKMFEERAQKSFEKEKKKIWEFMISTNPSNQNLFVKNFEEKGAFFAFRNVTSKGKIQTDSFKGAYEAGAAIWAMSLNKKN